MKLKCFSTTSKIVKQVTKSYTEREKIFTWYTPKIELISQKYKELGGNTKQQENKELN